MKQELRDLKAGDRVQIAFEDESSEPITGTVQKVLTDAEEGLAPEIEDYVACWVDVEIPGHGTVTSQTISLGTDMQFYLNGRKVVISK